MYAVSQFPSESSTETNNSGETNQIFLSIDDVTEEYMENSRTNKGTESRKSTIYPSVIDSRLKSQVTNLSHSSDCDLAPYTDTKPQTLQENDLSENASRRSSEELAPLLSRSQLEHTLHEIICSTQFKNLFEAEYKEVVSVRKKYESIRRVFLVLAVLSIILIVLTLLSFGLNGNRLIQSGSSLDDSMEEFMLEKLTSPRARELFLKTILCGYCDLPEGGNTFTRRGSENSYNRECCELNIFTNHEFQADITKGLRTFTFDLGEIYNSISRLDDAVIGLENKVFGNNTSQRLPSRFQKTLVHKRVDINNKLLNTLLNRKRSLLQMTGTVRENRIIWEEDITAGDVIHCRNNSIHVTSGGTYLLYARIQFSKHTCTGTNLLEYRIIKEKDSNSNQPFTVAHVKHGCVNGRTLEEPLNFQKIIFVPLNERPVFHIEYNTAIHGHVSRDYKTHNFGIIEL